MDYSNNRCGCMQRPHLPEPPHTNTGNSPSCSIKQPDTASIPGNAGRDCLGDMSVAMAYVPMQRWNQVYDMSRGLTRGTIFPELDLPFVMGRCR